MMSARYLGKYSKLCLYTSPQVTFLVEILGPHMVIQTCAYNYTDQNMLQYILLQDMNSRQMQYLFIQFGIVCQTFKTASAGYELWQNMLMTLYNSVIFTPDLTLERYLEHHLSKTNQCRCINSIAPATPHECLAITVSSHLFDYYCAI